MYCFDAARFWPALAQVTPENEQSEYYLTDVIGILHARAQRLEAVITEDPSECLGVNDRKQLAELAAIMRGASSTGSWRTGVTVIDPATTYVDDTVTIGADTVLHPGVILEGRTVVGAECVVNTGCHVADTTLGDRVLLKPYCVLPPRPSRTTPQLGPFCHLRPQSHVGAKAKVGNFVELKKSRIGRGSKVPHLSYVGDARWATRVNIGAGTITCNYDGVAKHETVIGDGVFVGTNSSLVAPLIIGEGAYVAAGSVITKNVPPGSLAVARGRQETREGWVAAEAEGQEAQARGARPMCGIVGYIGDKNAVDIVLEGLRRLEYRGYDSAGIAVVGAEAACRSGARPGGSRTWRRSCARSRSRAASASATRAGPPTAGPPTRTRTRTPTAPATSSSCTTASSRTTCRSRSACRPRGTSSSPRRTPRSSRT